MSESNSKIIRRDVRRKYLLPIIVRVFSDFLAIALPSVAAMLIGTMSDSLLALDRAAIMARWPSDASFANGRERSSYQNRLWL